MAVSLSIGRLDAFVGKTIEEICPLGFGTIGDAHNHCAHFVSHVLKLNSSLHIGYTCAGMASNGTKHPTAGACIRVNEIYNFCSGLDAAVETGCLVYYTLKTNFHNDGHMGSMSQKHVSIYFQGFVWNYGNKKDAVRKNKSGDLDALYGSHTITCYTEFPDGATTLTLEEIQALAT